MNTYTYDHPAVSLLTDHPDRFARQGAVVAWRTSRGRRLGPQGRANPQPKTCAHHAHDSSTKTPARFHFRPRPSRQNLTQTQQLLGSKLLKGSEISGIGQAGPSLTAADVPPHLIPDFPFPVPGPLAALASQKPEFSPLVDQNNPHRSQPNSEFSPFVDQNDPHRPPPELEFSPFVDQNAPHHPPIEPKPPQVRNPASQKHPHDACKPGTKPPTTRARFPKAGQARNPTFTNMRAPCLLHSATRLCQADTCTWRVRQGDSPPGVKGFHPLKPMPFHRLPERISGCSLLVGSDQRMDKFARIARIPCRAARILLEIVPSLLDDPRWTCEIGFLASHHWCLAGRR